MPVIMYTAAGSITAIIPTKIECWRVQPRDKGFELLVQMDSGRCLVISPELAVTVIEQLLTCGIVSANERDQLVEAVQRKTDSDPPAELKESDFEVEEPKFKWPPIGTTLSGEEAAFVKDALGPFIHPPEFTALLAERRAFLEKQEKEKR